MSRILSIITILFCCCAVDLCAQQPSEHQPMADSVGVRTVVSDSTAAKAGSVGARTIVSDSTAAKADSVGARTMVSDSTAAKADSVGATSDTIAPATQPVVVKKVKQPHSAKKAMLLSILPGAGQVYNKQYIKVPIIYGIGAGLAYWCYSSHSKMIMFRDEYLNRVNGGVPELAGYTTYPDVSIYNLYTSNNQRFQLSIVLMVVVYAANLVDAYVFGHLFDFTVDDNISLSLSPTLSPHIASPTGFAPTLSVGLTF